MTSFIKLLGRVQFANLKSLSLPSKLKLGKTSPKQIAAACPLIEMLDITRVKAKDDALVAVAEHFPRLGSVKTDMWHVTSIGIQNAAQALGEQLLSLEIRGDTITKHYLSDNATMEIGRSCPNLRHFSFKVCSMYYESTLDNLTGAGVLALVDGCRNLESLELWGAKNVSKEAFVTIASLVSQSGAASASGNGV